MQADGAAEPLYNDCMIARPHPAAVACIQGDSRGARIVKSDKRVLKGTDFLSKVLDNGSGWGDT
jgi:hypothetical protein